LREAEEIEQTVLASRAAPAGTLRVTAPLPIARQLLAPALPGLRARFPRLSIDLTASDRFVDLVEEGIDVAIRVGDLDDSRLTSRRLAPHWVCAFASPAYLKRRGTPRHPDDLVNHDCVNFRFQSSGQPLRWPFRVEGREVELTPNAWAVADTSEAVSEILIAGGGIGIAPTYLSARYVARGELVPVLVDYAVERSVITALWPANRRNNPNVKVFLSLLKELFPSPAPWDAFLRKSTGRLAKASRI
jgi:DNA-binding transcriptional LysR family regulator